MSSANLRCAISSTVPPSSESCLNNLFTPQSQNPTLETFRSPRQAPWLYPHRLGAFSARPPRTPRRATLRFCGDDVVRRRRHRTTNANQRMARRRASTYALRPRRRRERGAPRSPRIQRARTRVPPRGKSNRFESVMWGQRECLLGRAHRLSRLLSLRNSVFRFLIRFPRFSTRRASRTKHAK